MPFAVPVAEFLSGTRTIESAKSYPWPEIAVVGRSNVGKSSFINRVTQRSKLAHSSSTPGSTREINFFRIQVRLSDKDHNIVLADLPGFGFAKFAKSERETTEKLIVDYVQNREELKAIFLLNDIRRMPERDELAIRDAASATGLSVLVVATKSDKLSKNERVNALKKLAAGYKLQVEDLVVTGEGVAPEVVWGRVLVALE
jgi:GTP-binding protein